MKHSEIYSLVEVGLREGKSKGDIYRELGGVDDIASAVAATPHLAEQQKYAKLNRILVVIVVYYAVIKFVVPSINLIRFELPIYILPFYLYEPTIAIWIAVQLNRFRGRFYTVVGVLGLAAFLNGISVEPTLTSGIVHLPLVAGALLAFFLKKRLFPNLGYMGAKTDSSGKYLFLAEEAVRQLGPREHEAAP